MNAHLSEESERFVRSLVQSGRFASASDAIEEALRLLQQREQASTLPVNRPRTEEEFLHHLMAIGMMSQLPTGPDELDDDDDIPISIQGEPISETVIRERR